MVNSIFYFCSEILGAYKVHKPSRFSSFVFKLSQIRSAQL